MSLLTWLVPVVHAAASAAATAPAITPAGAPAVGQDPSTTITNIATNIRAILLLLAGVCAVLYLMWSGFQYITAGGDPAKTKTARAGIVNAVIGIIIIVATTAIIRFSVGAGKCVAGSGLDPQACGVQANTSSTTSGGIFGGIGNLVGGISGNEAGNATGTADGPQSDCPLGTTQQPDGSCLPDTSGSNPCTDPTAQDCTQP